MEKLIFLDIEEFKKLKNLDEKDIILLEYPPKNLDLSLKSIEKFNIEEFFPKRLLKDIKKKSKKLFNEFYKRVDKKVVYKDIDLFFVIKTYLFSYFQKYIKYIDALDHIIKKNKPKKILVKYNESQINKDNFLDNPELSVSIIKEICFVRKIPIKIKLIKKKKKLLNYDIKAYLSNILGALQNIHFKIMCLKKSKKRNILFVGGKNAYLPILKDMRGKAKITRCGINPGQAFFNCNQDYYLTLWDKPKFMNLNFLKSITIKDISSMKYKRYSLHNIILPNLNYLFNTYFKVLIRWIDAIYNVEPYLDAVVTTNDTMALEQIIIKILKKHKKKSYVIQHGYTNLNEHFFPLIKDKMLADKMFVWGETSKKWMIKEGLKKENLIITGSIKFDEYVKNKEIINIRKKFNISYKKKIIFFIPSPNKNLKNLTCALSHKELTKFYRILFSKIEELKDFILIIKPHPSDEYEELPKEILKEKEIKNCIILNKKFPLKPLLKQSDLIITLGSTVTLESMFFKKPILILNFFNKHPQVPFIKNGMCIGLNDKNKLKKTIINSINNKNILVKKYEEYFKDYVLIEGKAHKRISNIILNNFSH